MDMLQFLLLHTGFCLIRYFLLVCCRHLSWLWGYHWLSVVPCISCCLHPNSQVWLDEAARPAALPELQWLSSQAVSAARAPDWAQRAVTKQS